MTKEEYNFLRSQFGTLKRGEHSKYLPYTFTEQVLSFAVENFHHKTIEDSRFKAISLIPIFATKVTFLLWIKLIINKDEKHT